MVQLYELYVQRYFFSKHRVRCALCLELGFLILRPFTFSFMKVNRERYAYNGSWVL